MSELTKDQINLIATKVMEINRKQHETEEQKEKDKRLRNTKLLLRNYHSFKKYAERVKDGFLEEEGVADIQSIILNGEDLVKSIRESTQRTLFMIRHLDRALEALKFVCEQEPDSTKPSSKHYQVLKEKYIDQETIEDMADRHCINKRSVYKSIDAAAERLSIMLFGVYGLKVK